MGALFAFLLSLFTGSGGIAGQIEKAAEAAINGKTEQERTAAQERVSTLQAQLAAQMQREADAKAIRLATAGQPEMRVLAFLIGGTFALHVVLIGVGTCLAAPLGWPWLNWTLHIPPFPEPFQTAEIGMIGFFFGYAAVTHSASAIAGAIVKRNSP